MPNKRVERDIAEESFDYGNHEIIVQVYIKYTNQYNNQHDIMNEVEGYHYYRFVHVAAQRQEDNRSEITHQSSVAIDVEHEYKGHWLFGKIKKGTEVPKIPDQVEHTVRPVLDELDELYQYTTHDTDIEIEVAMNRVEHEMSWVDVDDEVDRISKEIDSMAGEVDE